MKMTKVSIVIFLLALAALIYLVFFHKPSVPNDFRGPTGVPSIKGPTEAPPGN